MNRTAAIGEMVVLVLLSPLSLLLLILLLVGLPFYLFYRTLLRLLAEVLWVARGKRILPIYSRSPVWQDYIETTWLPRLKDHAIVLNWSDRSLWRRATPFAAWVFRHWAPAANFNPMAIVFHRFPRIRRIWFYDAFRDWRHGNEVALWTAEEQLFEYVGKLARPSA